MSVKNPNRLIHSTSPYLLQHAYNPVDWFEWGTEAFEKARTENKPILVSIGYSACHWCHVMERETFENDTLAGLMNEHLVCIKVDREERPDVDQIYMESVQAMGIHGGWPLNVFLTPDQQPFYGGTYFPPHNWAQLVEQISKTFRLKRDEINQSADALSQHLNLSDLQRFAKEDGPFQKDEFDNLFRILESKYDATFGGLDRAPKFVMPTLWMWLLRYHSCSHHPKPLEMVVHTLQQLAMGGIYDQIGGGFARYSVDGRWFAPHFEKMLYDNAQLVSLYAEAYKVTPDPEFKRAVYETVQWLQREMTHPDGGFYSAIDADSEGVEGKYYTWTSVELKSLCGSDYPALANHFNLSEDGNWEHGRNILFRRNTDSYTPGVQHAISKLLEARKERIPPSLDDKILTGWNAMMIQGLLDAYHAFSDVSFLSLALKNISFIERQMISDKKCFRSFKNKRNETEGFLEDYAFLIQAYLSLYQSTFDEAWLSKASHWTRYVENHFWDATEGYFYFTSSDSEKLIARKKEIFDNVIPASNSVMARNMYRLGILLDLPDFQKKAIRMVSSLKRLIISEPSNTSNWACLALETTYPFAEIAIVGKDALQIKEELAKKNIPLSVLMGSINSSDLPLLKDKSGSKATQIYVCHNKTCKMPVQTVSEALNLLESN